MLQAKCTDGNIPRRRGPSVGPVPGRRGRDCSMHPKALSLFPAAGLLGGAASITLFYAIYAFVWLFGRRAVPRELFDLVRAAGFKMHIIYWSLTAQAAAAGAVAGLAVGSACPTRWSGPMVGVLAVVVGLVAMVAGVVGMLGETLTRKGP